MGPPAVPKKGQCGGRPPPLLLLAVPDTFFRSAYAEHAEILHLSTNILAFLFQCCCQEGSDETILLHRAVDITSEVESLALALLDIGNYGVSRIHGC
ncbi:hypothetical protein QQP08_004558 [Theobroma cacao]|nr:hypothetical protein QQP08_004558 [Theobroma cacao]